MNGWAIRVKNVNQNAKKGPLSHRKIKCSFLDYAQFLMIGQVIRAKNVDQNAKKWKRPPKSLTNQMFVFGLRSTSDDQPSNPSKKRQPKCKKNEKDPLSHQKIKCSFLDCLQLLMIGRAIQAKNINWNAKTQQRLPKSSKNKMFIFGLRSTSDDRPSDLRKKHQLKCKKQKRPPKSLKKKMFVFGLHSASDDRPSDPSKKTSSKMQKTKKGPLSHQKIKCSFLDYIQLLIIGQAISAKNVDWNTKKTKKAP